MKKERKRIPQLARLQSLEESSTSLKHWNLRTKLQLSMPEKLKKKKPSAIPKINWNKNGKLNQCMGNTQKE